MFDNKTIIGNTTLITIAGINNVPAKVDTGAASSAIWASNIRINDSRELEFTLFGEGSEFYTGKVLTTSTFRIGKVRNSTGHEQLRYRVDLPIVIKGKEMVTSFTLADRSRNNFPVLIGQRTLRGNFLVDVDQVEVKMKGAPIKDLVKELEADPIKFHNKYIEKSQN